MSEPAREPDDMPVGPFLDEMLLDATIIWRLDELEKRGFTRRQRMRLAAITDVVHAADRLLDAGCDIDTAFRLLW